jgi:aryl-alcohol dehydrogenase-like predicted oxidoreductase
MRTRTLGRSGLRLTTIGAGTYALGGNNWRWAWGAQDDADSIAAMRRGFDLGINWVDTAPAYGLGHAEEVVGQAIKGRRHELIVATKCGLAWHQGSPEVFGRLDAASVSREIDASLGRLGVDEIDLYQIHWPNPDAQLEEAWVAMADAVQAGKIRYLGASNFSVDQLRRVQAIHPVASLQPPYSMLERGVEAELLPFCAASGIGVIVYSPMQTGLLSGKFSAQRVAALPDDDFRKTSDPHFQEPDLGANLRLVEGLRPIAQANGRSVAQLAIAWVLRRPEVTAAIVGARRPDQIEETAPAADWSLSDADIAKVDALLATREQALAELQAHA